MAAGAEGAESCGVLRKDKPMRKAAIGTEKRSAQAIIPAIDRATLPGVEVKARSIGSLDC